MSGSARIRGLVNGGVVAVEAAIEDEAMVFGPVRRLDGAAPDLDDPNQ